MCGVRTIPWSEIRAPCHTSLPVSRYLHDTRTSDSYTRTSQAHRDKGDAWRTAVAVHSFVCRYIESETSISWTAVLRTNNACCYSLTCENTREGRTKIRSKWHSISNATLPIFSGIASGFPRTTRNDDTYLNKMIIQQILLTGCQCDAQLCSHSHAFAPNERTIFTERPSLCSHALLNCRRFIRSFTFIYAPEKQRTRTLEHTVCTTFTHWCFVYKLYSRSMTETHNETPCEYALATVL